MVYMLNLLIKGDSFPIGYQIGPGGGSDLSLIAGEPLSDEAIEKFPKQFEVQAIGPGDVKKQNFLNCRASLALSSTAKDILESLEPDVHQFVPIEIKHPQKLRKQYENTSWYYLKVCQRINAVDISRSVLKTKIINKGTQHEIIGYDLDSDHLENVYVRWDLVRDMNLWRGDNFCLSTRIFISRELKEAWEQLGQDVPVFCCLEI